MVEAKADCKATKTTVRMDADAKEALVEASAIVNALYRNLYEEDPDLGNLFRLFVTTSDDCWRRDIGGERVKIDWSKLK